MSNTEEKKRAKQWKVGITEKGWTTLNQFLELPNKGSKRRIKAPEVLEIAVQKLGERDIRKIQDLVYTPDDKMESLLEEYNQRTSDKKLSETELKATMVEMFEKQVLSKLPKFDNNDKNV